MKNLSMQDDFTGKTVVVTGGASGIGKETCLQFCQAGANVMVGDIAIEEGLKFVQKLQNLGYTAEFVEADISKENGCKKLIETALKRFGCIDVLFNNAGIEVSGSLLDFPLNQFDHLISTNLKSVFLCSQYAINNMMKRKSGVIVNVASVASFEPWPNDAIYSVSKAGVAMLTKALAIECAPYSIRVNAVAPGIIDTPMTDRALSEYPDKAKVKIEKGKLHPLGRLGLAKEVANVVLFLSSRAASFITGVVLPVDGGYLVSRQHRVDDEK